jgi:transposase
MSLPTTSPEQRAEALRKAAEARQVRTEALNAIRSGDKNAADVLADETSPLQRARVRQLLTAVPGIGAVTADKILAAVGIAPNRRVAGLGQRQRAALVAQLAA